MANLSSQVAVLMAENRLLKQQVKSLTPVLPTYHTLFPLISPGPCSQFHNQAQFLQNVVQAQPGLTGNAPPMHDGGLGPISALGLQQQLPVDALCAELNDFGGGGTAPMATPLAPNCCSMHGDESSSSSPTGATTPSGPSTLGRMPKPMDQPKPMGQPPAAALAPDDMSCFPAETLDAMDFINPYNFLN